MVPLSSRLHFTAPAPLHHEKVARVPHIGVTVTSIVSQIPHALPDSVPLSLGFQFARFVRRQHSTTQQFTLPSKILQSYQHV
jgi:hypothetical protein